MAESKWMRGSAQARGPFACCLRAYQSPCRAGTGEWRDWEVVGNCDCQREEDGAQVFAVSIWLYLNNQRVYYPLHLGPENRQSWCYPVTPLFLMSASNPSLLTSLGSEQCTINPGCCHLCWIVFSWLYAPHCTCDGQRTAQMSVLDFYLLWRGTSCCWRPSLLAHQIPGILQIPNRCCLALHRFLVFQLRSSGRVVSALPPIHLQTHLLTDI